MSEDRNVTANFVINQFASPDLIATNAAATLDVNTQNAVITYDEDGAGTIAPVTFTASTSAGTATCGLSKSWGNKHI